MCEQRTVYCQIFFAFSTLLARQSILFYCRYEFQYKLPKSSENEYKVMEKTDIRKSPSPLESPMFAGSAYYAWKREAVEFMIQGIDRFYLNVIPQ